MNPEPERVIDKVRHAVRLREAGEAAQARELLAALWEDVDAGDDPFARCFAAHSLADVQDDPREELRWDVIALDAGEAVSEERAAAREIPGGKRGLMPSLHLNLAESYLRVGDDEQASGHYRAGLEFVPFLGDDSYGDAIREAFATYAVEHPTHAAAE
jgi:hypothetical protein